MSLKFFWEGVYNIDEMKICGVSREDRNLCGKFNYFGEIFIVFLYNKFDFLCIFRGRKD